MQLNWLARYRPIVEQLMQVPGPVLEVGSGSTGVGLLVDRPFVGCDVTFERRPVPQMSATIGSATNLPFADRGFSVVVASDLLEHLPCEVRATAIDELIRVSRRLVIIGVPCGRASEDADRRLRQWQSFWHKPVPNWLKEHQALSLPACGSIELILAERVDVEYSFLPNENVWMHLIFLIIDMSWLVKGIRLLWRWAPAALNWVADAAGWGVPYRRIFVVERQ